MAPARRTPASRSRRPRSNASRAETSPSPTLRPERTPSGPLVLICGDEEFTVKKRARQIFDAWCAETGGMDHEVIDGAVSNAQDAITALNKTRAALQTLPFLGSAKVVWLKNCTFLGEDRTAETQAVTEDLQSFAKELERQDWTGVRLLISAGKVDKRKAFYKALAKLATVEEYAAVNVNDRDWLSTITARVKQAFAERGRTIEPKALSELVQGIGSNMGHVENEVEKLCLYAGDRATITVEDVRAISVRTREARAFALGEAVGRRQLPEVLERLGEEMWSIRTGAQDRKSVIGLLYGLITNIRAMLFAKEMIREGLIQAGMNYSAFKSRLESLPPNRLPSNPRCNPLKLHPFVLHRAAEHSRNYTTEELVQAMNLLLRANLQLVSSQLDEQLVLQQALVQIVRGEARSGR